MILSQGCDTNTQGRQQHETAGKPERSSLAKASDTTRAKTKGQQIALDLRRTIHHFYPDLYQRLEAVEDPRRRRQYSMTELLLGATFMFIAKEETRNAFNNDRAKTLFLSNYEALFGLELPHMDTVDAVLRVIDNEVLERLKASLLTSLIEKKVFGKFRMLGRYYRIAADATGVQKVKKGHCPHCLHKKSKTGKIIYFHNLLEAKLVTPNGFAISLASEWIENPDDYNKQDCEQKAFKRLAEKIKKIFPRLPIAILADGLYPNAPFFDICKANDWRFVVTLKDKSLTSLWAEVDLELLTHGKNVRSVWHPQQKIHQAFRWLSALTYQKHELSWVECVEEKEERKKKAKEIENGKKSTRFVYLTDIESCFENVIELATSGRLRFKIENEGFNELKNHGYNLSHKFSRVSALAMKNYVSLMHIAHLFNQLYLLSPSALAIWLGKETHKNMWKDFIAELLKGVIEAVDVLAACAARIQIRYD